jgi:hypothetical protein
VARNPLQIGDDGGNALSLAPWQVGDPTDPMVVAGAQNVTGGMDALGQWLAAMRAKSDARATPFWNVNNPVGTETTRSQQSMSMPDASFRPGVFAGGGTVPLSAEQIDAFRAGSQHAYDQLSQIAGVEAPGGIAGAAIAEGRIRNLRNPLPPRMAARLTDVPEYTAGAEPYVAPGEPYAPAAEGVPVPGIGSNRAPTRNAIWANPVTRTAAVAGKGRMGSNADVTLESLGLPAYADIVPSTNTGPVSEAQVRAGGENVVKPGNVFDLSDTWRVPDVPQTELSRIDPDAGRRKGLPEHIIEATTDPEMRAKLRTVAEAGLKTGGAYWYNAEPLRLAFVTELGPEEGNATFAKYMRTVGAVSAGSDVGQNIRTGSYYNVRERQGNPVQGEQTPKGQWAPTDIESPYGHKMQNTQYGGYRDIQGGNPLDPEMRPKRASFDENLGGNQEPVTVDKHNLRLIGMLSKNPEFLNTQIEADVNYPSLGIAKGDKVNFRDAYKSGRFTMDQLLQVPQAWKDVPEANHYAALEGFQRDLAREMGISPAQLQAALWVGGGRVTGLRSLPTSFMGAFEQRLQKTAAERGGTPMKALLDFVRGKKPLLTPLVAAGAGAAANALQQPDDGDRR